jgi:hypothetical protein
MRDGFPALQCAPGPGSITFSEFLESFIIGTEAIFWDDCVIMFVNNGRSPTVGLTDRHGLAMNISRWTALQTISR